MAGTDITISSHDGGSFSGYLAIPPAGRGPGLVVVQEIFGVNSHIREVTDQWAARGYLAVAPDMFWRIEPNVQLGYTQEDFLKARAFRPKFDFDKGIRDIQSAIDDLRANPNCTGKVGAVGYCFGGALAYLTAARTNVDVAIGYYGGGIDQRLDEVSNIRCPLMLHFGETDQAIPAEARDKVAAALKGRDNAEVYVYAGAGHGFNNWARPQAYHKAAAEQALARTVALLKRTIGPC
jgi:carboxymethylenebutenolidase